MLDNKYLNYILGLKIGEDGRVGKKGLIYQDKEIHKQLKVINNT